MKLIVILGLISFATLVYGRVCPGCVEFTEAGQISTFEPLLRKTLVKLAESDKGPKYALEKVFMVTVNPEGAYIYEAELLDHEERKIRCEVVFELQAEEVIFNIPNAEQYKVSFQCPNKETLETYVDL